MNCPTAVAYLAYLARKSAQNGEFLTTNVEFEDEEWRESEPSSKKHQRGKIILIADKRANAADRIEGVARGTMVVAGLNASVSTVTIPRFFSENMTVSLTDLFQWFFGRLGQREQHGKRLRRLDRVPQIRRHIKQVTCLQQTRLSSQAEFTFA
jgi:hypothetical protein